LELVVDNLFVTHVVNRSVNVSDVVIVKATEYVQDSICLANVRKELVAETFALRCAFDQTCDVNDFDGSRNDRTRLAHLNKTCQSVVRHGDDAYVRLDCAEWEVC
jgi:hypothetical protein